jgi:hypothetical protein
MYRDARNNKCFLNISTYLPDHMASHFQRQYAQCWYSVFGNTLVLATLCVLCVMLHKHSPLTFCNSFSFMIGSLSNCDPQLFLTQGPVCHLHTVQIWSIPACMNIFIDNIQVTDFCDIKIRHTILIYTHSFILQSVLRQVRSLFQSEFSTGCDLVLPLSISTIFSFP